MTFLRLSQRKVLISLYFLFAPLMFQQISLGAPKLHQISTDRKPDVEAPSKAGNTPLSALVEVGRLRCAINAIDVVSKLHGVENLWMPTKQKLEAYLKSFQNCPDHDYKYVDFVNLFGSDKFTTSICMAQSRTKEHIYQLSIS